MLAARHGAAAPPTSTMGSLVAAAGGGLHTTRLPATVPTAAAPPRTRSVGCASVSSRATATSWPRQCSPSATRLRPTSSPSGTRRARPAMCRSSAAARTGAMSTRRVATRTRRRPPAAVHPVPLARQSSLWTSSGLWGQHTDSTRGLHIRQARRGGRVHLDRLRQPAWPRPAAPSLCDHTYRHIQPPALPPC
jgi:hypothetical protein